MEAFVHVYFGVYKYKYSCKWKYPGKERGIYHVPGSWGRVCSLLILPNEVSKVVITTYTPICHGWGSRLLHILTNAWHCSPFNASHLLERQSSFNLKIILTSFSSLQSNKHPPSWCIEHAHRQNEGSKNTQHLNYCWHLRCVCVCLFLSLYKYILYINIYNPHVYQYIY